VIESIRVRNIDHGIEIELVGEITNMIKATSGRAVTPDGYLGFNLNIAQHDARMALA
jgi:hypothetical protein